MSKINFLCVLSCVLFFMQIGNYKVFSFELYSSYISLNVSQVFVNQTFTLKCIMPANGQVIKGEISMNFYTYSGFHAKIRDPGKTQNKFFQVKKF